VAVVVVAAAAGRPTNPGMRASAILLGLLLAIAAAGSALAQQEEILSFDSRIEIGADGTLTVTESITVRATGRAIKRGIYRDFPTVYRWPDGRRHGVGFVVLKVLRDGRPEPWFQKRQGDMQRVYIGDKKRLLDPGRYSYTLTYRTDRQIGFFENHDELYWNVTGNEWKFPIRHASAAVILPAGAEPIETAAYTGGRGARGTAWTVGPDGLGDLRFVATRRLAAGEGLTIVVAWPKGYVTAPTVLQEMRWWISDNLHWIIAVSGFAAVLLYYLLAWRRVGRDPAMGTIVPLFEPPHKVSPAQARYIMRMAYDDKALTASVVNLAVQGFLRIDRTEDGYYRLSQNKAKAGHIPASRGERAFLECIFEEVGKVVLKNGESRWPWLARRFHKKTVIEDCEDVYHTRNDRHYVIGFVASLLAFAPFVYAATYESGWRAAVVVVGGGTLLVLTNMLFKRLLPAPTALGHRTRRELHGFRMYLATAEQDRLDALHRPERTPALFEKYLPYAIALDVENEWGEQFRGVLAAAAIGATAAAAGAYQPAWYDWGADTDGALLADRLGTEFSESFGDSFAVAAVAPPGSSSGLSSASGNDYSCGAFSSGGSSGGGGGGGGGGGW
jgi:uncharacterized membrane protein YgcG